ncbi:MAG: NADPH:quinone oxidoreductase family protein [Burkholderiaceae bacterium]|nr:NADPH:quinone oxidoreductase family protein [Burkholderiaceae bacterium]
MKALVCHAFGPIENLRVEDIPVPEPGPGQVRVRVRAAALNFPDALIVQGLYQVKPAFPFSPGAELSGEISALGEGVKGFVVGDRVIAASGHGGFAEECVVDVSRLMPLLPGMSFEQGAALVLTFATSLHALKDCAHLKAGETVLVLGAAGGVGLSAVEIAKAMGARVIAAASSPEKLALAKQVGADELIDYSKEDLKKRVDELTDKKGVEVVYDPVGGPYSEPALRATAWRGRFLVIGFAAGEIPKLPLNLALLKERSIIGVYWGDSTRRHPAEHLANLHDLATWFAQGKIKPVISETVGLDGAADAIKRIANRQVKGKVVVVPG